MASVRSVRPTDLVALVAYDGSVYPNGAITRVSDGADLDEGAHPYKYAGTVAAVVRSEEDFGQLAQAPGWELKEPDPKQWVWTDDYSSLLPVQ